MSENPETEKRIFFSIEEAAYYLSVERSVIEYWAIQGKLPATRLNEGWRFDKDEIDKWATNTKN